MLEDCTEHIICVAVEASPSQRGSCPPPRHTHVLVPVEQLAGLRPWRREPAADSHSHSSRRARARRDVLLADMSGARDAGNRAEILIDRAEVAIPHVLIGRPRHDLQQRTEERRRQTRVERIRIEAGPDRVTELFEGVAADWAARNIRCQVARNNMDW